MSRKHIDDCIRGSLQTYFKDLEGSEPHSVYDMVLKAVERPMLAMAS